MTGPRMEPPERGFPPGVEDALDTVILFPRYDSPAEAMESVVIEGRDGETAIAEFGKVVGYEEHADFDEDGGHYEVTLEVRSMDDRHSIETIRAGDLDEWAIPEHPPQLRTAAARLSEAEALEVQAKRARALSESDRKLAVRTAACKRCNGTGMEPRDGGDPIRCVACR